MHNFSKKEILAILNKQSFVMGVSCFCFSDGIGDFRDAFNQYLYFRHLFKDYENIKIYGFFYVPQEKFSIAEIMCGVGGNLEKEKLVITINIDTESYLTTGNIHENKNQFYLFTTNKPLKNYQEFSFHSAIMANDPAINALKEVDFLLNVATPLDRELNDPAIFLKQDAVVHEILEWGGTHNSILPHGISPDSKRYFQSILGVTNSQKGFPLKEVSFCLNQLAAQIPSDGSNSKSSLSPKCFTVFAYVKQFAQKRFILKFISDLANSVLSDQEKIIIYINGTAELKRLNDNGLDRDNGIFIKEEIKNKFTLELRDITELSDSEKSKVVLNSDLIFSSGDISFYEAISAKKLNFSFVLAWKTRQYLTFLDNLSAILGEDKSEHYKILYQYFTYFLLFSAPNNSGSKNKMVNYMFSEPDFIFSNIKKIFYDEFIAFFSKNYQKLKESWELLCEKLINNYDTEDNLMQSLKIASFYKMNPEIVDDIENIAENIFEESQQKFDNEDETEVLRKLLLESNNDQIINTNDNAKYEINEDCSKQLRSKLNNKMNETVDVFQFFIEFYLTHQYSSYEKIAKKINIETELYSALSGKIEIQNKNNRLLSINAVSKVVATDNARELENLFRQYCFITHQIIYLSDDDKSLWELIVQNDAVQCFEYLINKFSIKLLESYSYSELIPKSNIDYLLQTMDESLRNNTTSGPERCMMYLFQCALNNTISGLTAQSLFTICCNKNYDDLFKWLINKMSNSQLFELFGTIESNSILKNEPIKLKSILNANDNSFFNNEMPARVPDTTILAKDMSEEEAKPNEPSLEK